MDLYVDVIRAAADCDRERVISLSLALGYLTGEETREMVDAHVASVMALGKPFSSSEPFDFGAQDITADVRHHIPVMLRMRLTVRPPHRATLATGDLRYA